MSNVLINIAIVVGVGLALFFMIWPLIDELVFRRPFGGGDPANSLLFAPNSQRRFTLNILRPVVNTIIIFGGGLLTCAILDLVVWGAIVASIWFFFLTQIARVAGQETAFNESRWSMVITVILLIAVYASFA